MPLTARSQALAVYCAATAVCAYVAQPLSDHPDFLREWLAAQDCVQLGHCWLAGSASSFSGLHNGALFSATLALGQWAGGDPAWAWWSVIAADAAAITLIWHTLPSASSGARALAAALCLAPVAADLSAGGVWAPSFLPLFSAMCVWIAAAEPVARRSVGWGAALGIALALTIDAHVLGALAAAGWLAVVIGQARWTAAATAGAVAAAGAWLLAPDAFAENCTILAGHALDHGPWGAGVAVAVGLAVGVTGWRRGWRRGWRGPLGATLPDWLAGAVPLAALVAGAWWTHRDLSARYLVAVVPPLALAVAASPFCRQRWRSTATAAAAVLAGVLALGPGQASLGHRWPVIAAATGQAHQGGLGWPAAIGAVQSYSCSRLTAAVLAGQPHSAAGPVQPTDVVLQLIDLPPSIDAGPSWQAVACTPFGAGQSRSWLRLHRPWLSGNRGQACLHRAGQPSHCQPLQPGVHPLGSGATPTPIAVERHMLAFPRLVAFAPSDALASTTTLELHGTATAAGRKWLRLLDLPSQRCPWRLTATSHFQVRTLGDAWFELSAPATGAGSVTFARNWGPGCDAATRWTDGPPCMLEVEADTAWLPQLVVP
ncbi:MAG: hypothetical protein EXR77_18050 [Myxococcales bacterium]|nr:hypothetical protein [Myxococcales bacterium]